MIRGENLKDAGDKSDYEKKRKPISVCVGVAVCVCVCGWLRFEPARSNIKICIEYQTS